VRRETHGRAALRVQAIADAERVGEVLSTPDEPEDGALAPVEDEAARLRRLLEAQAAALALNVVAAAGDMALVADAGDSPEDRAMRSSLGRRLRGAVSELPVRERTLVERHYFAGEPFDAIAEDLGISKSWASRLHAAAMSRLADELKDDA
jgi:RNA polymerase sigma factor for flagellar operon FliA